MRILYLDTSSSFLYSAIVDSNKLIDRINIELGKDLSTFCLSNINDMFKKNNISAKTVEKIIVVNGPGSFTGVRIGLTIAKTYAWCLNIPIVTISSLEAMVFSSKSNSDFIIPIIDARRNYVYSSIYSKKFEPIIAEQYISMVDLDKYIGNLVGTYSYISNDQFSFCLEKYDPDILKIISLTSSKKPINPHFVDANYLKLTEAEEKRNDSAT